MRKIRKKGYQLTITHIIAFILALAFLMWLLYFNGLVGSAAEQQSDTLFRFSNDYNE